MRVERIKVSGLEGLVLRDVSCNRAAGLTSDVGKPCMPLHSKSMSTRPVLQASPIYGCYLIQLL
jgi:hypothetical protein